MNPSSSSRFSSSSSKRKRDPDYYYYYSDDEPSSFKRPRRKNDVFINYSFEDVGKSFVSHLRGALISSSFTISDHTMLPVGEDMVSELLKAIEESEMYVIVFSSNYASSVRCLDELGDIMDTFRKFKDRKVLPLFFKVEPTDVRSQRGPFLEAFQTHETNLDPMRVEKWRQALKEAGKLSGHALLQNGDEGKFVRKIVKELEKMQRPQALHVTDQPVGIGSRAEELISTLRLDDLKDGVLVVAVFGFSGIGKTTIVKEVYNRIETSFDLSCFLTDIHDICKAPNWKVKLQKVLVSCLSRENKSSIKANHNDGVTKIRKLVCRRKVLLVLDDIDNFQQLEALGIDPNWFCNGSRIIVTTRDKRSLGSIPYAAYHTTLLNRRESVNLFTWLLFARTMSLNRRESLNLFTRVMFARGDPVNIKLIEEVVNRAGGLPLVLKVWSRHFQQHGKEQWPSILEALKRIPHGDVQQQLQLSYDSLTPRRKKLFLDIACFFDGLKKDLVVKVLEDKDLGFFPDIEIQYLVDKSLVEITEDCKLQMHRAISEMGHEIVRQEDEDEPGQRTRLSDAREVERVLTECSGTNSVESIRSDCCTNMQETLDALRTMSNLKLIRLCSDDDDHPSNFSYDEICFKKLKYMCWEGFPFKSLDNIEMRNVVVLQLTGSNLKTLWEEKKSLKKLRVLDVSDSYLLTKTGSFSGLENLEELYFYGCKNLEELHTSIGDLKKLVILDLRESIPSKRVSWEMIAKLASLQELNLGHSQSIEINKLELHEVNDSLLCSLEQCPITRLELYTCNLSMISGGVLSLARLKHLLLHNTEIPNHLDSLLLQLHELSTIEFDYCDNIRSIPNLPSNINSIKAWSCYSLVHLPRNMSDLKSLTVLHFDSCPKLGTDDPQFFSKVTRLTNLSHLRMSGGSISQVPCEIENLVSLKELDLSNNTFSRLPDTLSNLSQLLFLNIENCEHLTLLPLLPPNLKEIDARGCGSLDVMSSASIRSKVCKESPFGNRLLINLSHRKKVPDWCSFQIRGDVLSFVAPVHLGNICGVILCANTSYSKYQCNEFDTIMHNKTKKYKSSFLF